VRIESVHTEYARKGFFRIGILPVVIAERVVIEVGDERQLAEILRESLTTLHRLSHESPLEIRGLSLRFRDDPGPVLWAGDCRFSTTGSWLLTGGVRVTGPDGTWHIDHALLEWTPAEGVVVFADSAQSTRRAELAPLRTPRTSGRESPLQRAPTLQAH
jgi:hypothetical protein